MNHAIMYLEHNNKKGKVFMEQKKEKDEATKLFAQLNEVNRQFILRVIKDLKLVQEALNIKPTTQIKQKQYETSNHKSEGRGAVL